MNSKVPAISSASDRNAMGNMKMAGCSLRASIRSVSKAFHAGRLDAKWSEGVGEIAIVYFLLRWTNLAIPALPALFKAP